MDGFMFVRMRAVGMEILIYVEGLGGYMVETRIFVTLLCSYVILVEAFWRLGMIMLSFVVSQLLLRFG